MSRTGRPPKVDGRKDQYMQIRTTAAFLEKLDFCANAENTTRTAIVEQSIDNTYQSIIKKQTD